MTERSVTVRVPATSANLGPGFDAVGLALQMFADITITVEGAGERRQRPDPMRRMVATAVRAAYKRADQRLPRGLSVAVKTDIPVGRGLGASAVARAAGVVGANAILGGILDEQTALALGAELEGHADNIAPALFGGLQVCAMQGNTVSRVELPLHPGLRCVGFIPDFSMPTHETRALLPKRLSRDDAVHNSSRAALLVAALTTGRWDTLSVATDDRLHQRPRSKLFPHMYDLFSAATDAGAFAAYLSGGGSTVIALTDADHAKTTRDALAAAAAGFEIGGRSFIVEPAADGARVLRRPQ
ncbi:MAG: homoserine kinase, partial [Dehalococcoidia bacterium]